MRRPAIVIGAGAARGVGAALGRRFAREGLPVVLAARSAEPIRALAEQIHAEGGRAEPVAADATRAEDVARIFDAAEQLGGAPELVVYNPGNNRPAPLLEVSDSVFEDLWRLCAFGGFLTGREAARRMLPAGGGTLIFTGATASIRARPPFTAFASAKAAERAVAHGMAREFGAQGLHVAHVVIDGAIDGERLNRRFPELRQRLGEGGMLDVDDIADAYWYLHTQPSSAWTLELDLRPYKERF